MAYERDAEPVTLGYLMDLRLPEGYLVARELDPDGEAAHTVDRFGEDGT